MRTWWLVTLLLVGASMAEGCANPRGTCVSFVVPRIYLHTYEPFHAVEALLHSEELTIERGGPFQKGEAHFVILGTGTLRWGSRVVKVGKDGIEFDGTVIDSRSTGARNALLLKDGTIEKDAFIPFEPWWGYHPSRD